jgi:hypothetical protein
MELTKEQIEKINKLAPNEWQTNEQGIFTEPFGIPDTIKEPVLYMRYHTGGVSGGSCWESSNPQPYITDNPKPKFEVLDLVLKELMLNISFFQFREIEKLIHTNSHSEYEYYGNSTDFNIEYIILSDLINALKKFT